ncbi:hypothetical protein LCGC14_1022940 [marine sediment metagenome]|uniref:ABC transporter domain-containing protein n=1 Tax=marine sediment metagenome TaxID=412755 RepID=A0A0F9N1G4_9ZZZZ
MFAEKYNFEKLNTEKGSRFLQKGEYIYLRNGISIETDQAEKGSVQNIIGNTKVAYTFTSAGKIVGEYEDKEQNRTIFFRYATDSNHGIYELDENDAVVKIIEWSGLNFTSDTRVEGVAVIGEILVWCDDVENIRKINIERGKISNSLIQESFNGAGTQSLDTSKMSAPREYIIRTNNDNISSQNSITIASGSQNIAFDIPAGASQDYKFTWQDATDEVIVTFTTDATFTIRESLGYPLPLEDEFITLIKRPPALPLVVGKVYDSSFTNNFIRDKAFQFYYRYIYDDDEPSVFAATSKLVNKSVKDDAPENGISVGINPLEEIPSTVKKIEYAYRVGNSTEWVIFDTSERLSNGTFTREIIFYNDVFGETIADEVSFKWFDAIPKSSKALEIIRNRIFLFNYVEGYDKTPCNIELSTSQLDTGTKLLDQTLYIRKRTGWFGETFSCVELPIVFDFGYFVVIDGLYYEVDWFQPTNEATVKSGENGRTLFEITTFFDTVQSLPCELDPNATVRDGYEHSIETETTGTTVFTSSPTSQPIFKSESSYGVAVMFHDGPQRHIGVHLGISNKISISTFKLPIVAVNQTIVWDLTNTPVSHIPTWATHFSIVRTPNLTKTYFLQHESADMWYYKEDENGDLTYFRGAFDPTYSGVLVDISNLGNVNLGYTFQEGDRLRMWDLNVKDWDVKIHRQEGKFVFIDIINIGTLSLTAPLSTRFETYSPYTKFSNETYYEVGEKYQISNAGQSGRAFSKLTGTLLGDITFLARDVYKYKTAGYSATEPYSNELDPSPVVSIIEAMSPRDDSFTDWFTDTGRGSPIVKLAKELRRLSRGNTLYILDEPTTGLHPTDVEKLQLQLARLVDAGNTVIVVEHDMQVIAGSDWIIDIGPGAGEEGGKVVAAGTPEKVAKNKQSKTATYLTRTLSGQH